MEWISVRARLPEEKEPVITCCKMDRFFAARYAIDNLYLNGGTTMTRETRIQTCLDCFITLAGLMECGSAKIPSLHGCHYLNRQRRKSGE